jgi:glycosyltransferase involved in cell wall biosynthesis
MLDSIHTARWLEQFQGSEVDFLLFPSSPHRRLGSKLRSLLTSASEASYSLVPGGRWLSLPLWFLDKLFDNSVRGVLLRYVIKRYDPDFIHTLELQNAGYILLRGFAHELSVRAKVIVTNWGSDIYWFGRLESHRSKISALLKMADYYSAECERDVDLALRLGFSGKILPVIPNSGGFSDSLLAKQVSQIATRRIIAVKGYHGWVGRAKVALYALGTIKEDLKDFSVVVYSANNSVARLARRIAKESGLSITVHGKGTLSHANMMRLFESARIYVGISESDGISTSLLEAMAMGAIPVQTDTSCCTEWFQDTGVVVREISKEAVAKAILQALRLSEMQHSSDRNREIIRDKASAEKVFLQAKKFYSLD